MTIGIESRSEELDRRNLPLSQRVIADSEALRQKLETGGNVIPAVGATSSSTLQGPITYADRASQAMDAAQERLQEVGAQISGKR